MVWNIRGKYGHERDEQRRGVVREKGCQDRRCVVFVYPIILYVRVGATRLLGFFDLPESSNKPFYCFDGRHEPQLSTDQTEKGVHSFVQLGIFSRGHLCSVFILALLAK